MLRKVVYVLGVLLVLLFLCLDNVFAMNDYGGGFDETTIDWNVNRLDFDPVAPEQEVVATIVTISPVTIELTVADMGWWGTEFSLSSNWACVQISNSSAVQVPYTVAWSCESGMPGAVPLGLSGVLVQPQSADSKLSLRVENATGTKNSELITDWDIVGASSLVRADSLVSCVTGEPCQLNAFHFTDENTPWESNHAWRFRVFASDDLDQSIRDTGVITDGDDTQCDLSGLSVGAYQVSVVSETPTDHGTLVRTSRVSEVVVADPTVVEITDISTSGLNVVWLILAGGGLMFMWFLIRR